MQVIRESGHLWECWLSDNGTLDTVIEVRRIGNRERNSHQPSRWFAVHSFIFGDTSEYRRSNGEMTAKGVRELAREGIQGLEIEEASE